MKILPYLTPAGAAAAAAIAEVLAVPLLVLAVRHNQWSVRRLLPPRPSGATQPQGGQPA